MMVTLLAILRISMYSHFCISPSPFYYQGAEETLQTP
jgi:hypothetical protein